MISMEDRSVSAPPRAALYGECLEDNYATRMVVADRHKLIWYPTGNRIELYDLVDDPQETKNLANEASSESVLEAMQQLLLDNLYGQDQRWIDQGRLVGEAEPAFLNPTIAGCLVSAGRISRRRALMIQRLSSERLTDPVHSNIVIMGVAASGKTTLAKNISERFGHQYNEGDAYHSAANIKRMKDGVPLTDKDREPWLKI